MTESAIIQWSPSKIKTHRDCNRKMFGEYVEGWKPEQGPGAALGDDCHELWGLFLVEDIFPAEDAKDEWSQENKKRAVKVAIALLPELPDGGTVAAKDIEMWARLPAGDRMCRGRIDWLEILDEVNRILRVNDFKTTSNLGYAHTERSLRKDPQAIMYAAYCILKLGAEKVVVRFMYVCTVSPYHTKMVETTFTAEDILGWDGTIGVWNKLIEEDMEVMAETVELESFADVEPSPGACGKYGGCDYRTKCAALGVDSLGAMSSIFDKTKAGEPIDMKFGKKKKKKGATPAGKNKADDEGQKTLDGTDPGAINPEPTKEKKKKKKKDKKKKKKDKGQQTAPEKTSEKSDYTRPTKPLKRWSKTELVAELLDNDLDFFSEKPAPKWRVDGLTEEVARILLAEKSDDDDGQKPENDDDDGQKPENDDDDGKTDEKPKKKKKKKKKQGPAPKSTPPSNDEIKTGFTLFVGCAPARAPYTTLEEICEPLLQGIAEVVEKKELDKFARQFPQHPFTIQFARGRAALQAVLLTHRKEISGNVVCRRGSALTDVALDVLIPRALEIIRAEG